MRDVFKLSSFEPLTIHAMISFWLINSAKNNPAKWTAINATKGSLKIQKCGGCKAQTLKMSIKYFEMAVTKQMPYF